jgi:hypothetical protein
VPPWTIQCAWIPSTFEVGPERLILAAVVNKTGSICARYTFESFTVDYHEGLAASAGVTYQSQVECGHAGKLAYHLAARSHQCRPMTLLLFLISLRSSTVLPLRISAVHNKHSSCLFYLERITDLRHCHELLGLLLQVVCREHVLDISCFDCSASQPLCMSVTSATDTLISTKGEIRSLLAPHIGSLSRPVAQSHSRPGKTRRWGISIVPPRS